MRDAVAPIDDLELAPSDEDSIFEIIGIYREAIAPLWHERGRDRHGSNDQENGLAEPAARKSHAISA